MLMVGKNLISNRYFRILYIYTAILASQKYDRALYYMAMMAYLIIKVFRGIFYTKLKIA